jgi:hypothetical protein
MPRGRAVTPGASRRASEGSEAPNAMAGILGTGTGARRYETRPGSASTADAPSQTAGRGRPPEVVATGKAEGEISRGRRVAPGPAPVPPEAPKDPSAGTDKAYHAGRPPATRTKGEGRPLPRSLRGRRPSRDHPASVALLKSLVWEGGRQDVPGPVAWQPRRPGPTEVLRNRTVRGPRAYHARHLPPTSHNGKGRPSERPSLLVATLPPISVEAALPQPIRGSVPACFPPRQRAG